MDLLDETELIQIRYLIGVSSLLSIAGSCFILATYISFPNVRSFPVKLLSMLSVSDLFGSVFHFSSVFFYWHYGDLPSTLACQIQGGGIQFFSMAAFSWSLAISVTAYMVVVKKLIEIESYEKYFHAACWGFPAFTLIPLIVKYPDMGPNWCWVGFEGNDIRFSLSYGPAILLLLTSIMFYGLTVYRIYTLRREAELESLKYVPQMQASINAKARVYRHLGIKIAFRLSLYVLVFVICWIWAVINRLHVAIYNTEPEFILYALQAWFTPLQGLFNALVYGNNKQVRQKFVRDCLSRGTDLMKLFSAVIWDCHSS
eukprot:TRINITY_DN1354_c0_g1_i2.p1 TRINITY_DN1354_c0_g1~~TRINITY_DN1354_c0_g1_i2.p1  ORF type:complete len:314 (-),score=39.88 TRINITY_DN1354_c0_g1_i2:509-1450(-)